MSATAAWADRIIGTSEADPTSLFANPANWRQHPLHQREALRGLLDRVGWVQQVVVNQRTGHLVDGHLRVALAAEAGQHAIPVLTVDLSEEEERLVLASLDPLAALAVPDVEALQALVGDLPELEGDLAGMLEDLVGQYASTDPSAGPGDIASEEDFWPVIRLQVSYDTFRAFERWWGDQHGEDDDEKVRALIG